MMIGCVLNSLLLFQLFLLLMDFNPFLITRGIPITGLFFIVIKSQDHPPPPPPPRIIHTNLSHLSCLLYPIVRSTCAFVLTSFRIIFVSPKFLHHFFFFFFRVWIELTYHRIKRMLKVFEGSRISPMIQEWYQLNVFANSAYTSLISL